MEDTVTISRRRWRALIEAQDTLNKLFAAGVDSWEGYSEAVAGDEEEEDA